ncbi:MAG: cytochrome c3 family protein [Deltaproteobacteria bacterium]|nr:cytochrome c3 family protein [Deltaproteobacteria bacterium]
MRSKLMKIHTWLAVAASCTALLVAAAPGSAEAAKKAKPTPAKKAKPTPAKKFKTAPLPAGVEVGWSHAPFEMGECSICHANSDPKNPGPINAKPNELCLNCHEQIGEIMEQRAVKHGAALESCVGCHNPHNAKERMLLYTSPAKTCLNCHEDIGKIIKESKVQHDSVTAEKACLNCHNPHASNVENLLVQLPFDLCVNCHGKDDMKASDGKAMTNFLKLLKDNPVHHDPVAEKDCSACHKPHGSEQFRLLREDYPGKFYADYDPTNYKLCYGCHNDQIMDKPNTTTLTKFRDGDRNLHFVHVNKADRGRTCRACHEVHASKEKHQIREGVPYGKSGWVLKVNYEQTPTGGRCAKTCHTAKEYVNGVGSK